MAMTHVSRPPTPSSKEPDDRTDWRFQPSNAPTEWVGSYRPGGFHPIHPGDLLGEGRYKVVCKLGYGAFSTVWLAEHNQQSRIVAIKVARADARQSVDELRFYKLLAESSCAKDPSKHIVMPLDQFNQVGPNGEHQCLMFQPMGPSAGYVLDGMPGPFNDPCGPDEPSLTDMAQPPDMNLDVPPSPPAIRSATSLPPPGEGPDGLCEDEDEPSAILTLSQRKSLLKQLLLGLDCLHGCKIAHGDVNPGNLLLCIRPLSDQDIEQLLKSSKENGGFAPVRRIDGKQDPWAPRYLCSDQPLKDWLNLDRDLLAKVSDLGAAFTFDDPPSADKCATPAALRAPEIILNSTITHKIDIWSFGCLVYEFLTGRLLFEISGLSFLPQERNDDNHLLQMVDTLGQMPPDIFSMWSRRSRYFNEDMELIRSDVGPCEVAEGELVRGPSLEEAFRDSMSEDIGEDEAGQVLDLLRKILQYEPSLRPSTSELLEDPWFQSIDR